MLFKYSALLPIEYFNSPTIKLSVPEHLNDPFEYETSHNITEAIKNCLTNAKIPEEKIRKLSGVFIESIHKLISAHGIISLTETPRNSLMWAHYAEQHNGMCIGYNTNLINHLPTYEDNNNIIIEKKPIKVNYDNLRFSSEHIFNDILSADRATFIDKLTKKSDEWIYEKEHRCIVPYIESNKIIIKNKKSNLSSLKYPDRRIICLEDKHTLSDWISTATKLGFIAKKQNRKKTDNVYELIKPTDKGSLSMFQATLQVLSNSSNVSFLIDIPITMIESIYFGCKVTKADILPYFKKLGGNINIFHLSVCKNRFELIPNPVTTEYLKEELK